MASRATDQRLAAAQPQLSIQLVGGPTAILKYGGLRWLTDPTLSPPGEYGGLTTLTGPALDMAQQDPIDVVLLSHHQHTDNLDPAGRAFLASASRGLSTTKAAEDLGGNVVGMEPWTELELKSPHRGTVKVTAVHAQHGPDGSDPVRRSRRRRRPHPRSSDGDPSAFRRLGSSHARRRRAQGGVLGRRGR